MTDPANPQYSSLVNCCANCNNLLCNIISPDQHLSLRVLFSYLAIFNAVQDKNWLDVNNMNTQTFVCNCVSDWYHRFKDLGYPQILSYYSISILRKLLE